MEFISLLGGYSCAHSIMGSKSLEVIMGTTNSGKKEEERSYGDNMTCSAQPHTSWSQNLGPTNFFVGICI